MSTELVKQRWPANLPSRAMSAAWLDSRLLPVVLVVLLTTDLAIGLNWLLSSPEDLASPAYNIAKHGAPMALWGALFLAAGTAAGGALLAGGRGAAAYATIPVTGLWWVWMVMFSLAPLTSPGASQAGAIFAGSLWALHAITGLAASHKPVRT